MVDRRSFLLTGLAAASLGAAAQEGAPERAPGGVRFGVIADIHHGLAPDARPRLEAFMAEVATRQGLDFLIQLGDFTWPVEGAAEFVALYNGYAGPRYHVLGNHDMDRGTKADALALFGAPEAYYSFTAGGYRFIVLDLNGCKDAEGVLHDYDRGNYFKMASTNWSSPEQLAWLRAELPKSDAPTIIFSHQELGVTRGGQLPAQQQEVFDILKDGPVVACLYGHLHVDRVDQHYGITCLAINSASYHWSVGMHPYRDPLFAFVAIDGAGHLTLEGRQSVYSETDPRETTAAKTVGADPWISDRDLQLTRAR